MTQLILVTIPLLVVWLVMLVDIAVRPDLRGWAKLLWVVASIFFWPVMIIYLLTRPIAGRLDEGSNVRSGASSTRHELVRAALRHRSGRITDQQFEEEVAQLRQRPSSD